MEKTKVDLSKGSFVSASEIRDKIDAQQAAVQIAQGQTDAEKEKIAAQEAARLKEIDELLPKELICSVGRMSFDTFKRRYKTIWDQVSSKDHLARGYCIFEHEAAPGVKTSYKTMRSVEMRLLSRVSPTTPAATDPIKYADEGYQYRLVRVAMGVLEWDGRQLAPLPLPGSSDPVGAWLALPDVAARLKMFENLGDELLDLLLGTLNDVTNAYRLALQENLKNQYAPL